MINDINKWMQSLTAAANVNILRYCLTKRQKRRMDVMRMKRDFVAQAEETILEVYKTVQEYIGRGFNENNTRRWIDENAGAGFENLFDAIYRRVVKSGRNKRHS